MKNVIITTILVNAFVICTFAQTTEFTFQGSLKDGANQANANYDFEFALYDSLSGGTQLGSTLSRNAVAVSNGTFAVKLDFGSQFPGANRFLEIRVRLTGQPGITTLSPRQQISNAPYAVRSLNAANADSATNAANATNATNAVNATNALQLGGVGAGQYVLTTDPRMTDARTPAAGSGNYIQNGTSQQTTSNFNISGNGTAGGTLSGNAVTATTQYNIGADRILSNAGSENLFAGAGAGAANTGGIENAFFGRFAGTTNSTGSGNSFFGFTAGRFTLGGSNNSFFGSRVGLNNSAGNFNSFFGHRSGENNNGSANSFFGTGAGLLNSSGNSNTFLGHDAGNTNSFGTFNVIVGDNADIATNNLTNAAALGANALVSASNSLVLGSINGVNSATADTNVGIGITAPASRLHISGSGILRLRINSDSNGGVGLALNEQSLWSVATVSPGHFQIFNDRLGQNALFISTFDNSVNTGTLNVSGIISVTSLGNAGSTSLCRNSSNQISICSSSIRYKNNINNFSSGLDLIRRLRPVSFNWKQGGMLDMGLVAEEVAEVEPLLATYNNKGEVEGVKYDRVGVVLINAVKEQQSEIELLRKQVTAMKALLCAKKTRAEICK